ncbi:MAG: pyruvate, phosphate dikinase [Bacillota bacterium]|jgi:pyruvate,orthophosphate dikinase|nr:pyruvate, phosphate dikinase [Bacillota bacterium]NLD12677.1 pyruvate, phosphate dikinase [Bacillota bacterium]HAV21591.1 pyruvate, phosphate dikinase [Bacillota bacterium]HOB89115.1 pyruvate, phosphate dikinase [Bacillota bacterium]HOJ57513.1 pyruvate, phosphate dikinase [Bacillota bacterium]
MAKKYVYFFGAGKAEGSKEMRNLLGGKGANLAEMTNLGIPVPPGFTITTEVCRVYYEGNRNYPPELDEQIDENLKKLEDAMGLKFGDPKRPLLVSVRSGARVSMPGMMDTVLNLGLNDETVQGLIDMTGNERFAYDAYRRFIQMFGDVVMEVPHDDFEAILEAKKKELGVVLDTELDAEALKDVVKKYKALVREKTGKSFPEDPREQLDMARDAVFGSWMNPRAITYRRLNNIPGDWGTAVNVQAMVFGNMGDDSGSGVAFTRDPGTGERKYYGEYLPNAQGEDVVAGIRTPVGLDYLEKEMPEIYKELTDIFDRLDTHYRDMQDLEFTVQNNKLYILQTRAGKRTAQAAVKIAVDMVGEGLITKEEAVGRVNPEQLDTLLHKTVDPNTKEEAIAKGVAASPGAAVGKVVFSADDAVEMAQAGEDVILVRKETSPDDIHGMAAAKGFLTSRGGKTSHAAVVARGMGKPAVTGCEAVVVDEERGEFSVNGHVLKRGDVITIDGSHGKVFLGEIELQEPAIGGDFATLMSWADEIRTLGVRANADTPEDAKKALEFGAAGIGLCRTEHMFFGEDRIRVVQQMILAETVEERRAALDKLLPFQKEDFKGILKAMEGHPVIIRLLDPPLHEFLPSYEELLVEVATMKVKGVSGQELEEKQTLLARVDRLRELNPMLGHRGCRVGLTYPEITEMQARAIFEAACELTKEGHKVYPEVMIPLAGHVNEIDIAREVIERVAEEVIEKHGVKPDYMIGTMIELPRAALTADEIAEKTDFFSFGTNDLTQTTFGFSRDDAEAKFLPHYLNENILPANPFETIDVKGVGELIKIAVEKGKSANPDLEIGICGEHGGDPASVEFCHNVGMDYVSCSPYRVPIARLAAAQAELKNPRKGGICK